MNMNEMPSSGAEPPATPAPVRRAEFHPALAINLMMTMVMVASIAYALFRFLPLLVALPVAIALSAVFGHMADTALNGSAPKRRIIAAIAAALIFLVTCGLSYGALYGSLFAEQSALKYFEEVRRPLMDKLNAQLANAETARQALQSWADSSKTKAEIEAKSGGSCPSRRESTGVKGPIATWRETEMQIANDLAAAYTKRLEQAKARIDPYRDKLPVSYAESLAIGAAINSGVETVEALAHGAFPSSTADTLKRQAATTITWKNGEKFACNDNARDEVMARAAKAVADLQAGAMLQPIKPAIDLREDKEVMITGLLRGFNIAAAASTVGLVGGFKDDPLMDRALAKGAINRETLPFALAALIELTVVLTAAWARERGGTPIPFEPVAWAHEAHARRQATQPALKRMAMALWHGVARALINLFYAMPSSTDLQAGDKPQADPKLTEREMGWADLVLPWLSYVHDCAYLAIPILPSTQRARAAARCLDEDGQAVLLASAASWPQVSASPEFAHRVEIMVPDAKLKRYEIYRLSPDVAQAFRLHWLEPDPDRHSGTASPRERA